jgi:dolichol-phosphate mannosyltransferase
MHKRSRVGDARRKLVAKDQVNDRRRYSQPGLDVYVSVIIPCHNEEECIHELHNRMHRVLEDVDKPYELIFVNDGSSDRTAERLVEIQDIDPSIIIVELSRNHGHQLALSAGLDVAQGERVLLIDADLQDPPELLPETMAALDAGADVAYAKRISRDGESRFKRLTAGLFYRFLHLLSKTDLPLDTGDFRLMSRRVADVLRQMPEPHRFIRGMVTWVGFRQVAVGYHRDSRFAGETKYSVSGMVGLAMDAITGFASAPLRFLFYLGAAAGVAAAGLLGWTTYALLFLHAVPAWAFLLFAQLMFSAINMFALGLIGEYVGRSFIQGKDRPLFIIRSVSRGRSDVEARLGFSSNARKNRVNAPLTPVEVAGFHSQEPQVMRSELVNSQTSPSTSKGIAIPIP